MEKSVRLTKFSETIQIDPKKKKNEEAPSPPTGLETALQQIQQGYTKVVVLIGFMIHHDDGCKKRKLFSR
jgi:regulator of PEP synthase PpsR (kinase-PPPase family)